MAAARAVECLAAAGSGRVAVAMAMVVTEMGAAELATAATLEAEETAAAS
jgi:hypothetical protein